MPKDFEVTVTDSQRAGDWIKTLGSSTVSVMSPIPQLVNLPGHPSALVYMLDLACLTPDQRARLVAHIAQHFNIPAAEVERDLDRQGVPILADDCIVSIANSQKWL